MLNFLKKFLLNKLHAFCTAKAYPSIFPALGLHYNCSMWLTSDDARIYYTLSVTSKSQMDQQFNLGDNLATEYWLVPHFLNPDRSMLSTQMCLRGICMGKTMTAKYINTDQRGSRTESLLHPHKNIESMFRKGSKTTDIPTVWLWLSPELNKQ